MSQSAARKLESSSSDNLLELRGKVEALDRVQAVIEFNLDGTVLAANENFLQTLGYELSEIQGKHHRMFCDSTYASSLEYKRFWEKLNRGEHESAEYRRFAKGGREVWINASYNPVFDDDGKVVRVVKFATDITAQKNSTLEVKEML